MVEAFNHLGYHDLEDRARPAGAADRVAVAIAGDNAADLENVAGLVDALGFDPVIAGPLADGARFEPGTELFGAVEPADKVRAWVSDRRQSLTGSPSTGLTARRGITDADDTPRSSGPSRAD